MSDVIKKALPTVAISAIPLIRTMLWNCGFVIEVSNKYTVASF
ncbi:MAG: hypothetical protein PSX81_01785 [bacterium]|nr:hypothetical protein [bacterium]